MRRFFLLLALSFLLAAGFGAPASALEACVVADPQDPTLNVREFPRGDLIGRLKNGDRVYIFFDEDIDYGGGKRRTWSYVGVESGAIVEPLGWVFRDYVSCETDAAASEQYPLYVGPGIERPAKTLGVSIDGYMKPEANRCYYYGDGGTTLSVSDEVLQSFKDRGFSLNSLCLGLMNVDILFDPDTGRRLPSMLYIDYAGVEKYFECDPEHHEKPLPGCEDVFDPIEHMSQEFVIDLPDCFKGGTPYSDCEMNFNMTTGNKIDAAERARIRAQGKKIEATLREAIALGIACRTEEWCDQELDGSNQEALDGLFLGDVLHDLEGNPTPLVKIMGDEPNLMGITAYDVSPALSRGFGYAIGPDGGAGPSANLQSAKLALAQKDRTTRAKIQALEDDQAAQ